MRFCVGIVALAVSVSAIAMFARGSSIPTLPIPVVVIVFSLLSGLLTLAVAFARRVRWSGIDFAANVTTIDGHAQCPHSEVVALAWIHTSGATQVGQFEMPLSHVEEARFDFAFITRDARSEVHRALATARERWNTMQPPKPLALKESTLGDSLSADRPGVVLVASAIGKLAAATLRSRLDAEFAVPAFERGPDGRWTMIPA